jgi:hypothetical protein
MRTLFRSIVGSRLFHDEKPTSDYDICDIFQVPTKVILEGRWWPQTKPQQKYLEDGKQYEATYWEIGHLIQQLIKGNQNAIWMATSDLELIHWEHREKLDKIVRENLSKASFKSIAGMATSQYEDSFKRNLGEKGIRSAWRTANFGAILLREGRLQYLKTPDWIDECEYFKMMDELDGAVVESQLPPMPDPEPFYKFLYKIRREDLEGAI